MTTQPLTRRPSAGAAPAATDGLVAPQKRRLSIDQRYVAPLLITAILLAGQLSFGILESYPKTLLAIGASVITEIVLSRLMTGKWPHLASAYISGISVGILVRSIEWWPYVLCAVISIMSKYVIRVNGRHLWNPSNLGIATLLFLAPQTVASLSVQWGNTVWPMIIVWCLGSIIVYRLRRFHICATYVASFVGYAALRSLITGDHFFSEVAPITGPMYQLFIFFMITDPKTTVTSRSGQMIVAFLVATMESALRLSGSLLPGWERIAVHAPYYALFLMGPSANLLEIWRERRRGSEGNNRQPMVAPVSGR